MLLGAVYEQDFFDCSHGFRPRRSAHSPLLANVYLHTVLDEWFEKEVKPRLSGDARLFRYADGAVIVFAREDDARRVFEVLPKRAGCGKSARPDL